MKTAAAAVMMSLFILAGFSQAQQEPPLKTALDREAHIAARIDQGQMPYVWLRICTLCNRPLSCWFFIQQEGVAVRVGTFPLLGSLSVSATTLAIHLPASV